MTTTPTTLTAAQLATMTDLYMGRSMTAHRTMLASLVAAGLLRTRLITYPHSYTKYVFTEQGQAAYDRAMGWN